MTNKSIMFFCFKCGHDMDIAPNVDKACECEEVDLSMIACFSATTRLSYDVFFPGNVLAITVNANYAVCFREGSKADLYSLIA